MTLIHKLPARPILQILPSTSIYKFGDTKTPVIHCESGWTINEGEAWAVFDSGSGLKTSLFQTLQGHLRLTPPPPPPYGLFPFLAARNLDPYTHISLVSFANRPQASGGFYDYTARYGALRDEQDKITFRQSMFPETIPRAKWNWEEEGGEEEQREIMDKEKLELFQTLVKEMGIEKLMDIPTIALSNGQTRRARILKALLSTPKPELLLLDEPLTGLDASMRPRLTNLLQALHSARSPRILLGLRAQDPIPDWITHVANLSIGRELITGLRERFASTITSTAQPQLPDSAPKQRDDDENKQLLVNLVNVNVRYGDRHVLKDINWKVRAGDRWHLQGSNGSGKTTLLSMITGDHPQSYTQRPPSSSLDLFSTPRQRIPTTHLRTQIGVASPEMSVSAFRTGAGPSVEEVVRTGFDGVFFVTQNAGEKDSNEEKEKSKRVKEVLNGLGPSSWKSDPPSSSNLEIHKDEEFMKKRFNTLSPGERSIVYLMRALVGRQPLVILDEAWAGMEEGMVAAARRYLRDGKGCHEDQAIIVVNHWEGEVPWGPEDGVKKFRLTDGEGKEVN